MSSRRLQDMSSRHLQDMSSKRLQDMFSRHLQDMSSRCLQDQQMLVGQFVDRGIVLLHSTSFFFPFFFVVY